MELMPNGRTKLSPFVRSFSLFCCFVPPMLHPAHNRVIPIVYKALFQILGI